MLPSWMIEDIKRREEENRRREEEQRPHLSIDDWTKIVDDVEKDVDREWKRETNITLW